LGVSLISIDLPCSGNQLVQSLFSDMTEGGMSEIMGKCGGLDDTRVETTVAISLVWLRPGEVFSKTLSDLGDLKSMCETIMKDLAFGRPHYLSDTGESPKCICVEDTIAIPLKRGAESFVPFCLVATVGSPVGWMRRGGCATSAFSPCHQLTRLCL